MTKGSIPMIEIIPNWHPVFVHFTVGLLGLAVVFHLAARLLPAGGLRRDWSVLARWLLWIGAAFALATAYTGWLAYHSVAHDGPSHAAMKVHRNWALATAGLFVTAALWSCWRGRTRERAAWPFVVVLLVGGGLLASTAWHGAELVYRHGLGVMSLPQVEDGGHAHQHPGTRADDHASSDQAMHGHDHPRSAGAHGTHGETPTGGHPTAAAPARPEPPSDDAANAAHSEAVHTSGPHEHAH
jgi:uncharacterized membrane protein